MLPRLSSRGSLGRSTFRALTGRGNPCAPRSVSRSSSSAPPGRNDSIVGLLPRVETRGNIPLRLRRIQNGRRACSAPGWRARHASLALPQRGEMGKSRAPPWESESKRFTSPERAESPAVRAWPHPRPSALLHLWDSSLLRPFRAYSISAARSSQGVAPGYLIWPRLGPGGAATRRNGEAGAPAIFLCFGTHQKIEKNIVRDFFWVFWYDDGASLV